MQRQRSAAIQNTAQNLAARISVCFYQRRTRTTSTEQCREPAPPKQVAQIPSAGYLIKHDLMPRPATKMQFDG